MITPEIGHRSPRTWISVAFIVGCLMLVACSDDVGSGPGDCPEGETWNPISETCTVGGDDHQQPGTDAGDPSPDDAGGDTDGVYQGPDAAGGCVGLECEQVQCDPDETQTALTGTVTIPSGTLPLPDVTVYVPETPLQPINHGASCVQCGAELSAEPFVDTQTDVNGHFDLRDVPVGEDVPLVVEIGNWRKSATIQEVEPCAVNTVDPIKTRLPRNTDEGEMPQIAVSTGAWDAIECLIPKIGIDKSEITTDDGDGRVHLFTGEGGTDRFDDTMNDGAEFTDAYSWWTEAENLLDYDILINSCEGSAYDKGDGAYEAFQEFVDDGGRAFLSHWHSVWLRDGTSDMQSVADWGSTGAPGGFDERATGFINDSFPKGERLQEWMYSTGTMPEGEFEIQDVRGSVGSLDEDLAQDWVSVFDEPFMGSGIDEFIQYFSFNTPVGVDDDQQCGRVVFSDIHVSADDDSSPSHPYPTGCTTEGLTDQEKALVFMFFDLAACIIPDDKKKGDW